MDKKYYFWITAVVIIAILIYFLTRHTIAPPQEDEQVAVTCANKTVFRYKYPSKIFPVIINDYSTSFKIASGVLDRLISDSSGGSSASVDVKNIARQIRDTLDQDNIFFENNLKAYFLASNDDPCNDSLRFMYTAYIKEMTEKVIELKQFLAQISSPAPVTISDTNTIQHDSVLAVVDTATKHVDTGTNTNNLNANQLVIKKDYKKINSALGKLQINYKRAEIQKNTPLIQTQQ